MRKSKPNNFDERLQHSISLLQKAEKLALKYDGENGFYLAFSGGKDSQALYHVAQMAGVKFQAHMNFTSVDPPQVIRFVRKQYPDVITHAPTKSIYQLAIEHQLLPSRNIRWCCTDFKEYAGAGKVCLIGIRAAESARRAKRHEVEVSDKKFSGNIEQFLEWQKTEIERREGILLRRMKREGKKVNEDEFTLKKDNEVRCINGKDSILVSPIFDWSENDVWYFLNEVAKVPHCSLYDNGYKRIGCICCPMSTYKQRVRELQDFPHVKRNWLKAIKTIRRGWGDLSTDTITKENRRVDQIPRRVKVGNWHRKELTGMWAGFRIAPLQVARQRGKMKMQSQKTSLIGGFLESLMNAGMPKSSFS
ncbi:MAG: phosphoadenosine phosphosulfate reductase family protein [Prevotella sp.]|nr:phosphoadenosine phosphosulfate reductase family protein [Prevotella sp.]